MKRFYGILFLTVTLFTVVLICSCSGSKDNAESGTDTEFENTQDAKYTEDNPYILENAELTYEETLYPVSLVNSGPQRLEFSYPYISSFPITHEGYDCHHDGMVLEVTKVASKTYYWNPEEQEKPDNTVPTAYSYAGVTEMIPIGIEYIEYKPDNVITFTRTTLRVNKVVSGSGDNFENIKTGDTIDVIEQFGYSPEGVLYCAFKLQSGSDTVKLYEQGKLEFLFYVNNDFPNAHLNTIYGGFNTNSNAPTPALMRIGHQYNIVLYDDYIMDEHIQVWRADTSYYLPHRYTDGAYFGFDVYEMSEEALQTAYEGLQKINPAVLQNHYLTVWQLSGARLDTILGELEKNKPDERIIYGVAGFAGGIIVTASTTLIICKAVSKKRKRNLPR